MHPHERDDLLKLVATIQRIQAQDSSKGLACRELLDKLSPYMGGHTVALQDAMGSRAYGGPRASEARRPGSFGFSDRLLRRAS
ncbi:MAG: hypothetical protein ACRDI2_16475 [Chloroflexota bacterium]